MITVTGLTTLNDNAAITFLSTLVPGFTDGLKYAVVAGAVTGEGFTVIANAPNRNEYFFRSFPLFGARGISF